METSDYTNLFARSKWESARTLAENAWREGLDIDANPYNQKTDFYLWHEWNKRWKMCNLYG